MPLTLKKQKLADLLNKSWTAIWQVTSANIPCWRGRAGSNCSRHTEVISLSTQNRCFWFKLGVSIKDFNRHYEAVDCTDWEIVFNDSTTWHEHMSDVSFHTREIPIVFYSVFSQTDKNGNIGIFADFVFPYICSFLFNLQPVMLVNVKLDISGCNSITFEGCRLHLTSTFLMAQLKWRYQYCHSCIVQSLWKTLLVYLLCSFQQRKKAPYVYVFHLEIQSRAFVSIFLLFKLWRFG